MNPRIVVQPPKAIEPQITVELNPGTPGVDLTVEQQSDLFIRMMPTAFLKDATYLVDADNNLSNLNDRVEEVKATPRPLPFPGRMLGSMLRVAESQGMGACHLICSSERLQHNLSAYLANPKNGIAIRQETPGNYVEPEAYCSWSKKEIFIPIQQQSSLINTQNMINSLAFTLGYAQLPARVKPSADSTLQRIAEGLKVAADVREEMREKSPELGNYELTPYKEINQGIDAILSASNSPETLKKGFMKIARQSMDYSLGDERQAEQWLSKAFETPNPVKEVRNPSPQTHGNTFEPPER